MKVKFLFFLLPLFSFSQAVSDFPDGQTPYVGGYDAYYRDFREIIKDQNIKPCANEAEFYQFTVLVNPDATISFVKDRHEKYLSANKCAADLAREVAKYQDGWNPAVINGVKQPAIATFTIFPKLLFQNAADAYQPSITYPVYDNRGEKHLSHFSKQLKANLDLQRFSWNDRFTVEANFIITKEGKLEDIVLSKKTGLEEFDRMIYYAFKRTNKRWKPATVNGMPVDYRYSYVLSARTEIEY